MAEMLGVAKKLGALNTKGPSEGTQVGPLKLLGASLGAPVGRLPIDGDAKVLGMAEVARAVDTLGALDAEWSTEGAVVGLLKGLDTMLVLTGRRDGHAWNVAQFTRAQQRGARGLDQGTWSIAGDVHWSEAHGGSRQRAGSKGYA